jgi:geranylgeranyl pyrophosphate synthase
MTDLTNAVSVPGVPDYDTAVAGTAEEVRRLLKGAPSVIRRMTSHLAKASGKMIRARALLACALGKDEQVDPDAVKAAAAVELLHLATLVHDDIIDDADTRRGIAALHRKFGEKYAVLCGDWLFCTALDFVSTAHPGKHEKDPADLSFTKYLTEVCLGELRQNQNNGNYRLSEREYFRIIRGKTAKLFEACFYVGFVFSGEQEALKEQYTKIGDNIGIIFQLSDDCADYEAPEQLTKKPVLSDSSRGVVTLPLIHALKKDASLKERIAAGMSPGALKDAVAAAGGLGYTHAKIDALYQRTSAMIKSLDIGAYKKQLLMKLLCRAAGKKT